MRKNWLDFLSCWCDNYHLFGSKTNAMCVYWFAIESKMNRQSIYLAVIKLANCFSLCISHSIVCCKRENGLLLSWEIHWNRRISIVAFGFSVSRFMYLHKYIHVFGHESWRHDNLFDFHSVDIYLSTAFHHLWFFILSISVYFWCVTWFSFSLFCFVGSSRWIFALNRITKLNAP